MIRFGKHAIVGGVSLLALALGAACSTFVFPEDVSHGEVVTPAVENIRENFFFNETGDVNTFDTKYYNVTFLSQAAQSLNSGNKSYYTYSNSNSALAVNSYSTVFGAFPNEVEAGVRALGGIVNKQGDTINSITFNHVSSITVDMLRAMGSPVANGLRDRASGDNHPNGYPINFLNWSLDPYARVYLTESDLNSQGGWFHTEIDGGWGSDSDGQYYRVFGIYPYEEDLSSGMVRIPNFSLPIASILRDTDYASNEDIYIYPVYSSGKDYREYHYGNDGNTRDSIALSNRGTAHTSDSSNFVSDSVSKNACFSGDSSIRAYRISGVDVAENNTTPMYIGNDPYVDWSSWIGDGLAVQEAGNTHEHNLSYSGSLVEGVKPFNLAEYLDGGERYNIYLFVKEYYASQRGNNYPNPSSSNLFSEDDLRTVRTKMRASGVHDVYSALLGTTVGRGTYRSSIWTYSAIEVRSYILFVEHRYETKMLGGETGTYDYEQVSSTDPYFSQNADNLTEYEARNITMNGTTTSDYDLYDGSTKLGTLTLPDTFFTIRLDGAEIHDAHPVDITYSVDPVTSQRYPATAGGQAVNLETFPNVTFTDTGGTQVTEYYFSRTLDDGGQVVHNESLTGIEERYSEEALMDSDMRDYWENDQAHFRSEMSGVASGTLSSILMDTSVGADAKASIRNALAASHILSVPIEGQYNLYLRLNYVDTGSGTEPSISVFAYRVHNIFVKVINCDISQLLYNEVHDENGNVVGKYLNVSDAAYQNLGIDCYSSLNPFYIYDKLDMDDIFAFGGAYPSLSEMFASFGPNKCLMDVVTGRYVTPWSLVNDPFWILKNYVLCVVDYPGSDVIPYSITQEGETA